VATPQVVAPGIGQPSAAANPPAVPAPQGQSRRRADQGQTQPRQQAQAAPAAAPGFNF
jgi:hypothetical protein